MRIGNLISKYCPPPVSYHSISPLAKPRLLNEVVSQLAENDPNASRRCVSALSSGLAQSENAVTLLQYKADLFIDRKNSFVVTA